MKSWSTSTRLISAMISLGVIITICAMAAIRRAGAVIAIIRPAVIFTVNPGQTARINVIGPTQGNWSSRGGRRMLLGFDVYRANETSPRSVGDTACVKYHMIERATQISPVFSLEGNDAVGGLRSGELVPTIEMREGGRTTGFLVLPAIQGVDESDDRR